LPAEKQPQLSKCHRQTQQLDLFDVDDDLKIPIPKGGRLGALRSEISMHTEDSG
jgi:hypothetical protein